MFPRPLSGALQSARRIWDSARPAPDSAGGPVGRSGEAAEDAAIERIPRLMFGVRGVPSTMVHQRLFAHGIVSTMARPSRLISDMGVAEMGGAVTVGLAPFNTETDIEQLIRTVASLA